MTGDRKGVHLFSVNGQDLAYDGATGALHRLDRVGRAILDWWGANPGFSAFESEPPTELSFHLAGRFAAREIAEAWEDFRSAFGGTLFGPDEGLGNSVSSSNPYTPWVKALCMNVAHDCNLACRYCFAGLGRFGGTPEIMTPETAEKAIEWVARASGPRKYIDVDFFGGEPLMAFDAVVAAIDRAKKVASSSGKVFRFTLTTNCMLLDGHVLDRLNREGVSLILSIDGRPEVHDAMRVTRAGNSTHSRVIENALRAIASRDRRDYIVRGTYTKHNLDFDLDVLYLYKAGFRMISLEPAVGEEGEWRITEKDLPAIRRSYERLTLFWEQCLDSGDPLHFYHFDLGLRRGVCLERRTTGCGAGYEYLAATPSGELYACHQFVGQEQYRIGDIVEGISDTELPRRLAGSRVPAKNECSGCWARYLCGGGCHARALASTGDLLAPDRLSCEITKTRLEFALYSEAKKDC